MSSEKHPNLQLHKWAPTDYVRREEWNENFGIIDEKIGILNEQLAERATTPENAAGDGVTDDSDILQSYVDSILSTGIKLLLPAKTFYVTKPISIKKDGRANVLIEGQPGTKFIKSSGDFAIFDIGSSTVPATSYSQRIQNVEIRNIQFECPDSTGTAIKIRNFGRLYIDNVFAYRFNKAYDFAGGSEAYINRMDWSGGNLGLILNVDDGLGGSSSGVDMQVLHVMNSQFSNGVQGLQLTNCYDVHFHNTVFAFSGGAWKGIVVDGNTQSIYFNNCHYEWGSEPAVTLNKFLNITFNKCEFAQTGTTTTNPIVVNNSITGGRLKVENSFYDMITNIPLIRQKETSEYVDYILNGNYPLNMDVSISYEKTVNKRTRGVPKKGYSWNEFNKDFTKGFLGLYKSATTVSLSLDTVNILTGANSVKFSAAPGYWEVMNFSRYGNDLMPGEKIFIDITILGTNFTAGVLRGVLTDIETSSQSVVVLQETSASVNVENYPNGFKRYILYYQVPKGKKLTAIRIDNSQDPSSNLYVDHIDIRASTRPIISVPTGTGIPTEGTFAVGDTVQMKTPTAGGYMGYVCTTAGTPGTWKGYGSIQA
jgi:hypothetical protein